MKHIIAQSATFNCLTTKYDEGKVILTGETSEGIEKGDEIVHPSFKNPIVVQEILERRDSRDFPKGNNMFYKIECI